MTLKCPEIESATFLCDDPAFYQINGTVLCKRHARRLMQQRKEFE